MSKLVARKKGVKRTVSIGKVAPETAEQVEDLDGRIEAIQWLIPLGLQAVAEELQRAVVELAGPRYQRKGSDQPLRRWGSQLGSVYLADQKLPVDVPRVRNVANHTEVPLDVYQALQTPRQMDEGLLLRMLKGIATRNYEACAEAVPEAFGLSSSSVSRRYVKGTARKLAEFKLEPAYYDLLGKVEYRLNDSHSLTVNGFLANDTYGLSERVREVNASVNVDSVDSRYGNGYGWLTLKSILSPDLYARTIVYGGSVTKRRDWRNFDLDPMAHLNSATIHDRDDMELVGLKQDWDYQAGAKALLKMGVDIKRLEARYDYSKNIRNEFITADDRLTEQVEDFSAEKTQSGTQVGVYLASRFKIAAPLTLDPGVRYDYTSYAGDRLWSPRLSGVYSLDTATFLRAGWGHYYQTQGIDELQIQFGEVAYHPAERAEHFVLGFEHLFQNGLHFRAEGYHKRMSDLRDEYYSFRDIDEFFPEARDDLVRLSLRETTATGIETYLKYDTGNKLSWWLSYVLSEAQDDVAKIHYDGRLVKRTGELPRAWDQRHTVNVDANYRHSEKWHFNIAWQYRSGWPNTDFTVKRIQRDDGSFAYYQDRGEFRGSRVPSYQRLDARINRHFHSPSGRCSVFLHIINLYDHENVIRYDHDIAEEDAEGFRPLIEAEPWFGITPFLGVSWQL